MLAWRGGVAAGGKRPPGPALPRRSHGHGRWSGLVAVVAVWIGGARKRGRHAMGWERTRALQLQSIATSGEVFR
uniref:Uncharacterized protein n=1 Tax=Oryza glaberrima TaxID=4538 RepID=I1NTJ3_ORYGL